MRRTVIRYFPGLLLVSLGMLAGAGIQLPRIEADTPMLIGDPQLRAFRLLLGWLLGPLLVLALHQLGCARLSLRFPSRDPEWIAFLDSLTFLPLLLLATGVFGASPGWGSGLAAVALWLVARLLVHRR